MGNSQCGLNFFDRLVGVELVLQFRQFSVIVVDERFEIRLRLLEMLNEILQFDNGFLADALANLLELLCHLDASRAIEVLKTKKKSHMKIENGFSFNSVEELDIRSIVQTHDKSDDVVLAVTKVRLEELVLVEVYQNVEEVLLLVVLEHISVDFGQLSDHDTAVDGELVLRIVCE